MIYLADGRDAVRMWEGNVSSYLKKKRQRHLAQNDTASGSCTVLCESVLLFNKRTAQSENRNAHNFYYTAICGEAQHERNS
jgi:hypothetical protein